MNTKQPHDQRQVKRPANKNEVEHPESGEGHHYIKNHGYSVEEFADEGEVTQFQGIRVIDPDNYENWAEFEGFTELNQSDWDINPVSAARLADGTILYEGTNE
jgi:hypothetical protein